MADIRIDALPLAGNGGTLAPHRLYEFPGMRSGLTAKLTLAQILGLIELADIQQFLTAPNVVFEAAAGGNLVGRATVKAALDAVDVLMTAHGITLADIGAELAAHTTALTNRVRLDGAQALSVAQQAQARANISSPLKGHIFGLTLANSAADQTNDIDIAAGEAASTEPNPALMVLASALTKRLDAAWAVGNNQGGRDTGSITDGTWHVWLIQRSDTGVVDALFSTSATNPTMPANYNRKRRIGSIIRASGAIRAFVQSEDHFRYLTGVLDRSGTSATGTVLVALSIPDGISVGVLSNIDLAVNAASGAYVRLGDAASGGVQSAGLAINHSGSASLRLQTDTTPHNSNASKQIYFSLQIGFGSVGACDLYTLGWIDTRGKDA